MKVKIKKKGKEKEFKLISKWEDVTLEKWIKLVNFKEEAKTDEALITITALSNIPKDLVSQLALRDVVVIMDRLAELQAETDSSLKKIIKVQGKEYGFHPDLEAITLGEYADLEQFIKLGIEDYLPEIMAILYRPIIEREGDLYTIKAYDGNIKLRAEKMKKMSAVQVQNALVFFYHLGKELLMTTELSLKERQKEMKKQLHLKPLQKNGDILE
jgi:sugar diacid utilization regulator